MPKINLKNITDHRFSLTAVELKDYIDFEVKRVYFITEPKKETGARCHKVEQEFFICLKGQITAVVDEGGGLEEIVLKKDEAIYVPVYVWHGFKDFLPDAILLALSSTNYNPGRSDYVEDYEEFKRIRNTK